MIHSYRFFEKFVSGLITTGLCVAVFLYVSAEGMHRDQQGFDIEAEGVINKVRSGFDVVDGIATSLRALPFSNLDSSLVSSYARSVIGDYPFITGFGRFESVPEGAIDRFVADMKNMQGGREYSVWWFDSNGEAVERSLVSPELAKSGSGMRYPVSLTAGDQQSRDVALQGFDIGSVKSVEAAIRDATYSGKTTLTSSPLQWQRPEQIIAVRVSYGGQFPAGTIVERTSGADGGYWLALDMARLGALDGHSIFHGLSLEMFDETAEYDATSTAEILFHRDAQAKKRMFYGWFNSNEVLNSFKLGDQTLIIRVSRPGGLTTNILLSAGLCALLMFIFCCLIWFLNHKRRHEQFLKKQQSEKLYCEQQRASVTLASIGDGVITTDETGCIEYANHSAASMLGVSVEDMRGKPVAMLSMLCDSSSEISSDSECQQLEWQSDSSGKFDKCIVRPDGSILTVNQTVSRLPDMNGDSSGSVIVLRDVSAEKELTRTLEHRVNHDALTGLANRVQFENCLARLFEGATESDCHAICFIDLDRFKQINDTCGHAAGDRLLIELSSAMQSKVRNEDVLARLGGDEFGIVLRYCEPHSAESVARRIQEMFDGFNFEHDGKLYPVRGSIGLVNFNPRVTKLKDVLDIADAACYQAKKNGSNNVQIKSVHETEVLVENAEELWVPRIQAALDGNDFEIHLQPIASISPGERFNTVAHHEFLLRMKGNDGQLIYPGNFIKPAERSGFASEIDLWVIENCLACISSLAAPLSGHLFSLNLFGQTIKSTELFTIITESIERHGVHPSQLCFEVRESEALNNFEQTAALFENLRGYGCHTALDDFGADLSSFSGLNRLAIDFVKIDEKYIADIASSDADRRALRALASYASSLGALTIAEKVECVEQFEALAVCRVDFSQGYFTGRPQSIADFYPSVRSAA